MGAISFSHVFYFVFFVSGVIFSKALKDLNSQVNLKAMGFFLVFLLMLQVVYMLFFMGDDWKNFNLIKLSIGLLSFAFMLVALFWTLWKGEKKQKPRFFYLPLKWFIPLALLIIGAGFLLDYLGGSISGNVGYLINHLKQFALIGLMFLGLLFGLGQIARIRKRWNEPT